MKYSTEDQVPPYPVALNPEMITRLEDCLQQLNITPIIPSETKSQSNDSKEISLLV